MKSTKEIYQKLNELTREAKTLEGIHKRENFEKYVWYSEDELKEILELLQSGQIQIDDIFKELGLQDEN